MKKILIFSGAGLDKESGIDTFRDSDGYWEKYNVMDVASMDGWRKNKELVLDFYNNRKKDFITKKPIFFIHFIGIPKIKVIPFKGSCRCGIITMSVMF